MTSELAPINASVLANTSDPEATVLFHCEQGLAALEAAVSLNEGLDILAKSSIMEHATRVVRLSGAACVAASTLRAKAERRCGELVFSSREAGLLAKRSDGPRLRTVAPHLVPSGKEIPATLADYGISHKQAAEFQRLAAAPEEQFEAALEAETKVASKRGHNVTRAGVLRRLNPEAEKRPDERWLEADRFVTTAKRLVDQSEAALAAVRFGVYPGDDLPLVPEAVERTLSEALAAITKVRAALNRKEARHG